MSPGRLVLIALALLLPSRVVAQPAEGLEYGVVDASTVRVFAVGTVGVEKLDGGGREIVVADPRAGHGTGFAVGEGGLVVTAKHVIDGARRIAVRLPGEGGFYGARVAYVDPDADVAVLDIEGEVAPLFLTDTALRVRQPLFAIGYPVDATRKQPQSARGIVAGRLDDGTLQLDMTLNPGNSGGPLLDEHDRVVGMVVARGDVSAGVQGIGFAVPASQLAKAIAEAQRRLAAGEVADLSARDRLGAVVVDELVQQGALHEIRKSADLPGGLQRADLDRAIDDLLARIDDADLLVFVAGTLWNGALAIEVGGIRTIGNTTLSDSEAYALADRLRESSIRACKRAMKLDDSVRGRSPFVTLALAPARTTAPLYEAPPPLPTAKPRAHEFAFRLTPHLRINPDGKSGWGYGLAASVAHRKPEASAKQQQLVGVAGISTGSVSFTGEDGEALEHRYVAVELGLLTRFGNPARHVSLLAAYTPGYYMSTVDDEEDGVYEFASAATYMHFRVAASVRVRWFQFGAGVRVLSGPTFWLEPLFVEASF